MKYACKDLHQSRIKRDDSHQSIRERLCGADDLNILMTYGGLILEMKLIGLALDTGWLWTVGTYLPL